MGVTVAANDVMELRIAGQLFGQQMINVLHFRIDTIPTSGDYLDACAEMLNDWSLSTLRTVFLAACPNNYTLNNVYVQRVAAVREVYRFTPEGVPGTGGAANPSQAVDAVITKQTGHMTPRHGRAFMGGTGDFHVPGIPTTAGDSGFITAGYLGTLTALAAQLILPLSSIGGGRYVPTIWHRKVAIQPSSDDVISALVQPQLRVMKRRVVGQGI